jgi:uncharacterized membrane protein YkvA (DUF1232 family)
MSGWAVAAAAAGGVLLVYAVLVVLLVRHAKGHADPVTLRDAVRLLPDILRLVRRLAADTELPVGVRVRLMLLLAYLLLPIDLIPDFIPVIGWADDAIVVALVLRSTIRRAGADALQRHWPGTPAGLHVIRRLVAPALPRIRPGT